MTSRRQRLARTLCLVGAIGVGMGAAPARTQQAHGPARSALDWSQAGGPLFPAAENAETGEASQTLAALELGVNRGSVWDGKIMMGPDAAPDVAPDAPLAPRMPFSTQPFDQLVETAASRHGLDPKLLHALVAVESAYRPLAVSPAGAGGLAQLMPGTASDLGVRDRFDPADNLNGGAAYLAEQLLRFGDVRLALAAYNAGPQRVARLGRVPDIAETRAYVAAVTDCYLALAAGRRIRSRADCSSPGGPS